MGDALWLFSFLTMASPNYLVFSNYSKLDLPYIRHSAVVTSVPHHVNRFHAGFTLNDPMIQWGISPTYLCQYSHLEDCELCSTLTFLTCIGRIFYLKLLEIVISKQGITKLTHIGYEFCIRLKTDLKHKDLSEKRLWEPYLNQKQMLEILIFYEYCTSFNFICGIFILPVLCDSVPNCRLP